MSLRSENSGYGTLGEWSWASFSENEKKFDRFDFAEDWVKRPSLHQFRDVGFPGCVSCSLPLMEVGVASHNYLDCVVIQHT